ncbi:MAG: SpoIIE family protein phosphatase [Bacteroidales bacterium]|nr:SpoIIE family protein phosphatase [Bacteroidales bacterium]
MNNYKFHIVPKLLLIITLIFFSSYSFSQLSEKDQKKLDEFLESAADYTKNEEIEKAAVSYYKAGIFCIEKNKNKEAIPYMKESAKLYAQIKNYEKVMKIYSNIGLLFANIDDYDKSLLYFQSSLKIRKNLGEEAQIASGLLDLAYVLSVQKKYKDAILNVIKALDISSEIQNSKLMLISYRMLAENYQKIGNEQKAGEYLNKFVSFRQYYKKNVTEEMVSDERVKTIAELSIKDAEARAKQLEYELMMKDKELAEDTLKSKIKAKEDSLAISEARFLMAKSEKDRLETEKKLAKIQQEQDQLQDRAKRRLTFSIFAGIIIVIVLISVGLLLNIRKSKKHNKMLTSTNKKIAEQNKNIELKNEELTDAFQKIDEQNKDINSSIDYAVNIQSSLLPAQENLNKFIKDSFILFKPRDKVSGDFYWFKDAYISNGTGGTHRKVYISAIDCTGHGVPGAFLSMMSYNLLDNIIDEKHVYKPGEILDELHKGVRKTLRQEETANRDGMDMALCSYDPENNILEFAGAKNPLIYMKDGKIYRLKGNIKPIGGIIHQKSEEKYFNNNIIKIDSPTTAYMFSDGFADQVGEETGRKLMTKFFRNLLAEIHEKPMDEQREILDLFLKKWQGNTEQIDDIIVIGFKLYPNKI